LGTITKDMVGIRIEDRITIVTIDRPEARNAVDRDTAEALVFAFRQFDADPLSEVAILTGAHGNFCADRWDPPVCAFQNR